MKWLSVPQYLCEARQDRLNLHTPGQYSKPFDAGYPLQLIELYNIFEELAIFFQDLS